MEVAVREQQFKQVYSAKHLSVRIVFSVEEMLIGRVMVFLSMAQFLPVRKCIVTGTINKRQKIDGVASAMKDHRARIKSIQRNVSLLLMNR